jgi:transposase
VVAPWSVDAGDRRFAGAAGWCEQARLVKGDRRCLAGRREKGGEQVARSLLGKRGSRYHLVVDANGLPLAVRLAPGNENEQRHLLPLLDSLLERQIEPGELWADRGYDSNPLRQALRERAIEPRISQRRRAHDPIPAEQTGPTVWRGKKRHTKTRDPQARHRWPIERTNAWLKARRRIATRRDRKADNYLAFLHLGMILILARSL